MRRGASIFTEQEPTSSREHPPAAIDRENDTYEAGWYDGRAELLTNRPVRDEAIIRAAWANPFNPFARYAPDIEVNEAMDRIIAAAEQEPT